MLYLKCYIVSHNKQTKDKAMKKLTHALLAVISVILLSCSSYIPPKQYDYDSTFTIQKSYDKVWNRLIEYLAIHNVNVDRLDKENGYIVSYIMGRLPTFGFPDVDCGGHSGWLLGDKLPVDERVQKRFHIVVQDNKDNTTTVKVYVYAHLYYTFSSENTVVENNYDCVSTGHFERELHEFLHRK